MAFGGRHRQVPADLAETARRRLDSMRSTASSWPGGGSQPDEGVSPGWLPPPPPRDVAPGDGEPVEDAQSAVRRRHRREQPRDMGSVAISPRAAVVVVVVAVAAVVLGASYLWRSRAEALPVQPPARIGASSTPGASVPEASTSAAAAAGGAGPGTPAADGGPGDSGVSGAPAGVRLLVHVAGKVARPGVVELPAGSRVTDAVAAAGGAVRGADLAAVNLARAVVDGEQVRVPGVGEAPAAAAAVPGPGSTSGPDGGSGGDAGGTVDLNAATLAQLEELPGVGPVLAQRILDWREQNGRFTSVDELNEVTGIGEAKFAEMAPKARV